MLMGEVKDPRVSGMVTVTHAEVTPDLLHARIFVSVMGDEGERQEVMAVLAKAQGFVRRTLAGRLDLRRVPEIHFALDHSLDDRAHIEELLHGAGARGGGE